MAHQLPLDLRSRPALGRAAYLVSAANAQAVAMVDDCAQWPGGKLALVGPEGSGKTHLAHVWAEQSGALITPAKAPDPDAMDARYLVLEDVDQIAGDPKAEEMVFHLHNAILAAGGALMVTGRTPPPRWGLGLPDLASRLGAAGLATLGAPDEALLAGLMVKLFADRGMRVKPTLVDYLVPRIDRSFAAAEAAVDQMCTEALARGVPVGRGLAGRLFGS